MEVNQGFDQRREEGGRRGLFSNPLVIAGGAFLLGLVIGWFAIGWGIWPVEWENASAQHLRPDLQVDYMRMIIDSYNLRVDNDRAEQRVNELGSAAPQALATVAADPQNQSKEVIRLFQQNLGQVPNATSQPSGTQPADGGTSTTQPSFIRIGLIACAIIALLLVGVAVVFVALRSRGPTEQSTAMRAAQFTRETPQTDYAALGTDAPISQWMTTYLLGDDLFDDSFSIDSAVGEFLGECGVGIADTIGVGEPKRVSAFEVWLFDKNDIQTVTKVLMSQHTYNDDHVRERLSAKGEPVLARPGAELVLETETLQMVARVVDMSYGQGALPDQSFFERATIELAVWAKA